MFTSLETLRGSAPWMQMVQGWVDFEVARRFVHSPALAAKNRPSVVGEWIARARAITYKGLNAHPVAYGQDFRGWYTTLQPLWRTLSRAGNTFNEAEGPHDWACFKRSGKNGLLSVVAALYFWNVYIEGMRCDGFRDNKIREGVRAEWLFFVDDLTHVLEDMRA